MSALGRIRAWNDRRRRRKLTARIERTVEKFKATTARCELACAAGAAAFVNLAVAMRAHGEPQ